MAIKPDVSIESVRVRDIIMVTSRKNGQINGEVTSISLFLNDLQIRAGVFGVVHVQVDKDDVILDILERPTEEIVVGRRIVITDMPGITDNLLATIEYPNFVHTDDDRYIPFEKIDEWRYINPPTKLGTRILATFTKDSQKYVDHIAVLTGPNHYGIITHSYKVVGLSYRDIDSWKEFVEPEGEEESIPHGSVIYELFVDVPGVKLPVIVCDKSMVGNPIDQDGYEIEDWNVAVYAERDTQNMSETILINKVTGCEEPSFATYGITLPVKATRSVNFINDVYIINDHVYVPVSSIVEWSNV